MDQQNVQILLPILKKISLFENLTPEEEAQLANSITLMYYPANYVIFEEGVQGDALYLIKKGKVEIFHKPKDESELEKKVSEIQEGGFFGEMALVSDVPRNASVRTLEECEVFILNKENFKNLLSTNPSLAQKVSETVISRMKKNGN